MPMTEHPRYAGEDAEKIRAYMTQSNHISWAYQVGEAFASEEGEGPLSSRIRFRMLEVKRCAGGAPFVGDPEKRPAYYLWEVAFDGIGGWVAGPAELRWVERG